MSLKQFAILLMSFTIIHNFMLFIIDFSMVLKVFQILFIFAHLIQQLQKVCRVLRLFQNSKIWNFGKFFKFLTLALSSFDLGSNIWINCMSNHEAAVCVRVCVWRWWWWWWWWGGGGGGGGYPQNSGVQVVLDFSDWIYFIHLVTIWHTSSATSIKAQKATSY